MGRHQKFALEEAFGILRASMKRVKVKAVPAEMITVPPTLRDLAKAMSCSIRTAHRYLNEMERCGWIKRHAGARGIMILRRAAGRGTR